MPLTTMFGMLDILFDALQSIAGKNSGSSYNTGSRRTRWSVPPVGEPPAECVIPSTKHDDLRRIDGIGPKISSLLAAAGITTYSQLAVSRVEDLKVILSDAGLRGLANPSSWPEQARLADAGDWDAFQKLKDELQGDLHV